MPKLSHACQILGIAAGLAAGGTALAQEQAEDPMPATAKLPIATADRYEWLEGVSDDKALAWIRAENAKTEAELAATPHMSALAFTFLWNELSK